MMTVTRLWILVQEYFHLKNPRFNCVPTMFDQQEVLEILSGCLTIEIWKAVAAAHKIFVRERE